MTTLTLREAPQIVGLGAVAVAAPPVTALALEPDFGDRFRAGGAVPVLGELQ